MEGEPYPLVTHSEVCVDGGGERNSNSPVYGVVETTGL